MRTRHFLLLGLWVLWTELPCVPGQKKPSPPAGKPGLCPTLKGPATCVEECSSDKLCRGIQKCCSNGCGHVCTEPEFPEKPGECPTIKFPHFWRCKKSCFWDYECKGPLKCCSTGCGSACLAPERLGRCPTAPKGTNTICIARCQTDKECPKPRKCCNWGCTRDCLNPVYGDD